MHSATPHGTRSMGKRKLGNKEKEEEGVHKSARSSDVEDLSFFKLQHPFRFLFSFYTHYYDWLVGASVPGS